MPHTRRPRGAINREIVVSAALEIADLEGLGGLTIRAIAELLDTPAMTLYSTFSSKSELLDFMYFEVAGRLFAGVGHGNWVDELRSVGYALRETLSEHPNWTPLLSRPAPPLVSETRERLLAKMRDAGFSPEQAFSALSNVILTSLGLMLSELALREYAGEDGFFKRLEALKEKMDAEKVAPLHVTRQALKRLDRFHLGEIHNQALEALLVGIQAWLPARR